MEHALDVQGDLSYATNIDQMPVAFSKICRRTADSYARAIEANGMVISVQQLVQEWQKAWSSDCNLAWKSIALFRGHEGAKI